MAQTDLQGLEVGRLHQVAQTDLQGLEVGRPRKLALHQLVEKTTLVGNNLYNHGDKKCHSCEQANH